MLARELCDKNKKLKKPIILSHHMLAGMTAPVADEEDKDDNGEEKDDAHDKAVRNKMSKSNPNSAIFMEDSPEMVIKKVKSAWCIEMMDKDEKNNKNPILDYCENIIFPKIGTFLVERKPEHGGNKRYNNYAELREDFMSGALHPSNLKPSVSRVINEIIEPVRQHFATDPYARQLLDQIKKWAAEDAAKKAAGGK